MGNNGNVSIHVFLIGFLGVMYSYIMMETVYILKLKWIHKKILMEVVASVRGTATAKYGKHIILSMYPSSFYNKLKDGITASIIKETGFQRLKTQVGRAVGRYLSSIWIQRSNIVLFKESYILLTAFVYSTLTEEWQHIMIML